MRLVKRVAVGVLAAAMAISLMTACSDDTGSGNAGGTNPGVSIGDDHSSNSDKDKKDDTSDNNSGGSEDKKDDSSSNGDKTNPEKPEETPVAWENSKTSKIYPIDVRQQGGTVKFSCTVGNSATRIRFIRTASYQQRRLIEYWEDEQQNQYLWQENVDDWKREWWQLYDDGTYEPLRKDLNEVLYAARDVANGPGSENERQALAGKKTYHGKTYDTERFESSMTGIEFECTYYYEGPELKVIEVKAKDGNDAIYMENITLQSSLAVIESTDSILTTEEKTEVSPNHYTLRENVS